MNLSQGTSTARPSSESESRSRTSKKELGIKGRGQGTACSANGPALELLRGRGQRPDSWGDRELAVVIAEGVPDFLVASLRTRRQAVRAVFGICGPS